MYLDDWKCAGRGLRLESRPSAYWMFLIGHLYSQTESGQQDLLVGRCPGGLKLLGATSAEIPPISVDLAGLEYRGGTQAGL